MLSSHYTAIDFISKNEEYNPEKNTKLQVLEKLDITKSCLAMENNQLKCHDYSLLFSMCTNDDK